MAITPELLGTLRALESQRKAAILAEDYQRAKAAEEQLLEFVTANLEPLHGLRQTLKGTDEEVKHFLHLLPPGVVKTVTAIKKNRFNATSIAKQFAEARKESQFSRPKESGRKVLPECFDLTACDSLDESTACESSRDSEDELEDGSRGIGCQLAAYNWMTSRPVRTYTSRTPSAVRENCTAGDKACLPEAAEPAVPAGSTMCRSTEKCALLVQGRERPVKDILTDKCEDVREEPFCLREILPDLAEETTTSLERGAFPREPITCLDEFNAQIDHEYEDTLEVLCSDLYADFVYAVHGDDGERFYGKLKTMETFESVIKEFEETLHRKFNIHEDVAVFLAFAQRLARINA